ncbi:hypothetical protein BHE74_00021270 [Ensete ventricosum]|uniref:Uncharacterized protein n=1 Tax=Ensete ventricosum TaxID=4639 RepID=A0A444GFS0_ENSVE|nr:hypothetical protein B296_00000930 [Ensete ventricosum]RWW33735.1 hypothetical protein GW17_00001532 [Ensete ventricosum]RWW71017.1 hypothetical protein BHE74_00021270 [Ensete ventricosum]RZR88128.1 hypothetical protein BHM03_00015646 [Ensete ventricosum]
MAPRLQELMAFKAQQETKVDLASDVNKDGSSAANAPQKRKIGKALEVKQPPGKRKKYSSEPVQASERDSIRAPEQIKLAEETDKGQVEKLLDTAAVNHQSMGTSESRESKPDHYTDDLAMDQHGYGKRFARGNSIRKEDESEVDKHVSSGKFTGSVTFAAPRALVKPLGWSKREAKPDEDNEKPKSNDEFRDMLLKK